MIQHAEIVRLTIAHADTGDVLFEKIFSGWVLENEEYSNDKQMMLPFDLTKYRSEAISSVLQVISQLSRELDKGEISHVKFTPKTVSAESLRNKSNHLTLAAGSLGVSGDIQLRGNINSSKSKATKNPKTSKEKNMVLIEKKTQNLIYGMFLSQQEFQDNLLQQEEEYFEFKEFLQRIIDRFTELYSNQITNLPKTPVEKRTPEDSQKFIEFSNFIFEDFSEFMDKKMEEFKLKRFASTEEEISSIKNDDLEEVRTVRSNQEAEIRVPLFKQ